MTARTSYKIRKPRRELLVILCFVIERSSEGIERGFRGDSHLGRGGCREGASRRGHFVSTDLSRGVKVGHDQIGRGNKV